MLNLYNKKAFTLFEIVLAITLIASVVGVSMFYTTKPIDESKVAKIQSEVAILEMGIQAYKRDNPSVTINDISDLESSALVETLIANNYISRKPIPHIAGKKFEYKKDANGFSHVFYEFDSNRTIAVY